MRFIVMLVALSACPRQPSEECVDYIDAAAECFNAAAEAGLEVDISRPEADEFCVNEFPDVSAEQWLCHAAAYDSADCSTEEGLAAAGAAHAQCGTLE